MKQRVSATLSALVFALSLGACASGTPGADSPADSPAASSMSPSDARAFIAEVQAQRGVQPSTTGVTSMEEFLDVLAGDEFGRFEAASKFIAGKPGVDAMTLHVAVELSWSDGFFTLARIVEELGQRSSAEAKRLTDQKASGRPFSDADEQALARAQKNADFDAKAREALDVLAKDHLQAAVAPLNETLRQFPEDPRTYRVAAFYYLLSEDWEKFDTAIAWQKDQQERDAGVQYLRAMESLRRFGVRADGRARLRKALELDPKMVRAQAKLVFAEDGSAQRHAELEKLRLIAPRHPVVSIAGPEITSEFEMSAAVERAQAPAASPDAPPR
jgi:hypothetical protein